MLGSVRCGRRPVRRWRGRLFAAPCSIQDASRTTAESQNGPSSRLAGTPTTHSPGESAPVSPPRRMPGDAFYSQGGRGQRWFRGRSGTLGASAIRSAGRRAPPRQRHGSERGGWQPVLSEDWGLGLRRPSEFVDREALVEGRSPLASGGDIDRRHDRQARRIGQRRNRYETHRKPVYWWPVWTTEHQYRALTTPPTRGGGRTDARL